ncbi:class I SAM-dependent methyltransferase [Luminiphilus sp.]|nr:class I SAM-dependent methyltransferase [Luminiphilus sp.]
MMASRTLLLDALPKFGVVGEIGVWKGEFSKKILDIAQAERLHLFDMDFSICMPEVMADARVTCHQGDSSTLLSDWRYGLFDWIYVDGDHSYEGIRKDIEAAAPLIREGGYLVFNDYAHITPLGLGSFGVHRAVTEFAQRHKWKLIFLAWQRNGLYDVAIQAPQKA